jgi:predicted MFS family arabinose efflux permease
VEPRQAGLLQAMTNSASIAAGAAGSLLTGAAVDAAGGSYSAVFAGLTALYAAAAAAWWTKISSKRLTLPI